MSESSEVRVTDAENNKDLTEEKEKILSKIYEKVCLIKTFLCYFSIYY